MLLPSVLPASSSAPWSYKTHPLMAGTLVPSRTECHASSGSQAYGTVHRQWPGLRVARQVIRICMLIGESCIHRIYFTHVSFRLSDKKSRCKYPVHPYLPEILGTLHDIQPLPGVRDSILCICTIGLHIISKRQIQSCL